MSNFYFSCNYCAIIWSLQKKRKINSYESFSIQNPTAQLPQAKGLGISNQNNNIVIGSRENSITLWNSQTNKQHTYQEPNLWSITALDIAKDGSFFVSTNKETLKIWRRFDRSTLQTCSDEMLLLIKDFDDDRTLRRSSLNDDAAFLFDELPRSIQGVIESTRITTS